MSADVVESFLNEALASSLYILYNKLILETVSLVSSNYFKEINLFECGTPTTSPVQLLQTKTFKQQCVDVQE